MPKLNSLPRPCRDFEELILASLDAANGHPRPEFEEHLAMCPACRAFRRQLQELDLLLQSSLQRPSLPANFKERLLARVEVSAAQPKPAPSGTQQDLPPCSGCGFTLRDALGSVMESFHWVALVLSVSLAVHLAVMLTPVPASVPFRLDGWFGPGFAWFLGCAALGLGLAVALRERLRRIWEWI